MLLAIIFRSYFFKGRALIVQTLFLAFIVCDSSLVSPGGENG